MAWDPSAKPNFVKSIENENVYSITLNAVRQESINIKF